ncbi:MAG TPA: DUF937 domain-containing protein [Saprospiraceae bacterium]|nr:DUF937 domain-containing protein [Saprospiraceae bacterium]MCB9270701.1 DUF937 domain-containing protein [Lewinellaceae bacterium]HPG05929.1 DUF937 domain-containing protein [Saprospiraceae bacterium]HPR01366.1 DUF937 domain-containing protein [Saprospiraceae bacterium]HRV83456.1 DUF937 domain-containing protein [Saprospiraceae bacterium]
MNITDLLQGNLPDGLLDTISKQLGGADTNQTQVAAHSALSAITSAIARNAATPTGATSLVSALDRDHDGSILDDLAGFLSGNRQPANTAMLNGSGILNHVLGNNQSNVVDMITKMSGMDKSKAGSLLAMLAPLVMGALGKARNQQGLGVGDLTNLLRNTVQTEAQQNQHASLINRFLDQDGDGSIMDDLASFGMKFLSRR